jgi:hypothetical protein
MLNGIMLNVVILFAVAPSDTTLLFLEAVKVRIKICFQIVFLQFFSPPTKKNLK